MNVFKNHRLICQVSNPLLRMLLATATEPAVLEGLQKGFPHLFSETETALQVPLSVIRAKAAELGAAEQPNPDQAANHPGTYEVMEALSIPSFYYGTKTYAGPEDCFPPGFLDVVALKQGETFEFRGETFMTLEVNDEASIKRRTDIYWVYIVPADYVDASS